MSYRSSYPTGQIMRTNVAIKKVIVFANNQGFFFLILEFKFDFLCSVLLSFSESHFLACLLGESINLISFV